MPTRDAINIYPIISDDILNLKIADRKPIPTINAVVILKQIESHFLKFVISISSLTSFLYLAIRINNEIKRKNANIPIVF